MVRNLRPLGKNVSYAPGKNFYRRAERRAGANPVLAYHPLGNAWVAIEFVCARLGILTVTALERTLSKKFFSLKPAPITERMKQLGVRYSPEQICFPFKPILGYFFEVAGSFERLKKELGLNSFLLILTHESSGTCREREYGRLAAAKLEDFYGQEFGHSDFNFYIVHESLEGLFGLIKFLQSLSNKGFLEVVGVINEAIKRLDMIEGFEERTRFCQSLGVDFPEAEKILDEARETLARADLALNQAAPELTVLLKKLGKLTGKREEPIARVALIGEVFHLEEIRSCSADVIRELARRGFFPVKRVGIGHYTHRFELSPASILKQLYPVRQNKTRELAARGGLLDDAGGHSVDTVALLQGIIEDRAKGEPTFDGAIEVLPFNCQPQEVAANVALRLASANGIPYLRLIFDEQKGEAGVLTRLDAFCDLVKRKKKQTKK